MNCLEPVGMYLCKVTYLDVTCVITTAKTAFSSKNALMYCTSCIAPYITFLVAKCSNH